MRRISVTREGTGLGVLVGWCAGGQCQASGFIDPKQILPLLDHVSNAKRPDAAADAAYRSLRNQLSPAGTQEADGEEQPDLAFVLPLGMDPEVEELFRRIERNSLKSVETDEQDLVHIVGLMTRAMKQTKVFSKESIWAFMARHDAFIALMHRVCAEEAARNGVSEALAEDAFGDAWMCIDRWFRGPTPWDYDPDRPLVPYLISLLIRPNVFGALMDMLREAADDLKAALAAAAQAPSEEAARADREVAEAENEARELLLAVLAGERGDFRTRLAIPTDDPDVNALRLWLVEGKTYKVIATTLKVAKGGVWNRIVRAAQSLLSESDPGHSPEA